MAGSIVTRVTGGLPTVVVIIVGLAATYLAASLSYYIVEKPFLRLRARIESRYRLERRAVAVD
jgi:peptidoglycan/LPS O-acetylase OafA/YrhL